MKAILDKNKRKIKILHIAYGGFAGSPRGTLLLAQREKEVSDPYIIFFGGEKLIDEYKNWAEKKEIGYVHVRKKAGKDFSFAWKIPKILFREKPDVLFIHGTNKLIFALFFLIFRPGTKVIVVEHGPGLHLERAFVAFMARITNLFSDGCVFVSKDICDYWHKKFKRLPKRYEIIPNGVDMDEFKKVKAEKPKRPFISMVAMMSAQKDHPTLIKAFGELIKRGEDINLKFVGDGPLRRKIEELVKKSSLKERIEIISNPKRKTVLEIFMNSSVYVLSTNGEGLSRSVLEAMAARVPVVASDVSGNSGFITDKKDGILVPKGDWTKMADSIQMLLHDGKMRKRLAENAYNKISENHSVRYVTGKYLEFIKKVYRNQK